MASGLEQPPNAVFPGGEGRLNGREALFGVDAAERVEAASAVPQGPGGPALVCKAGQKLGCGPVKTGHITGGDHKAVALAGGKRCCQPGQRAHAGPRVRHRGKASARGQLRGVGAEKLFVKARKGGAEPVQNAGRALALIL